jgi:tetratricopeptide (TPR) repeat protein
VGLALVPVLLLGMWLAMRSSTDPGASPHVVDAKVLALYEKAMSLRDPPLDPALRWRLVEDAYRQIIDLDPDFAGGYAGLAFVLATRSWWGLSGQPEADARSAFEAATLAVEKDPTFAWGQIGLALAQNLRGDFAESAEAARLAATLGPDDPYTLSFSGLLQTFAGDSGAGVPLVRRALRLDPLSFRTPFRNVAGVVLFHAGLFEETLEVLFENQSLGGPDGPHMGYYRAATLARLGRIGEARQEIERGSGDAVRHPCRAVRGGVS